MKHISEIIKVSPLDSYRECMICELMCIPSKMYDKDMCNECNDKLTKEGVKV
jgi:hypothetical protein